MESPTDIKRRQLKEYIQREIIEERAVKGIVAIGSVATGKAGLGSDIDAVVFLDPLDLYAVPAEFQWCQKDGSYHGIFVEIEDAIQFDFKRVSWQDWSGETFIWPEQMRLELLNGWIAYDPIEQIEGLIKRKTAYTEAVRQSRLDDAIVRLDLLLGESTIGEVWRRYDPATAHDRLNDAYEYLVSGIFAYNRAWRPWRSREQSYLTNLKWTPKTWLENMGRIVVPSTNNRTGYEERARLLRASHEELMQACQTEGLYADKPVDEAFVRNHAEPGRDWNIAEWVERHRSERR